MSHEPTHLDLFSGIGGFSLAAEAAGFRTIGFAETDPDASLVLAHHWPDVPNLGDVTKLCRRVYDCEPKDEDENVQCPRCETEFGVCACISTEQFTDEHGFPDVITGGVPCQPASLLGHRRGTADKRWLWPEAIRIMRELRPRFGVFENPPAILTLEGGRAWNGIVSGLAGIGYDLWWDVLPAAAVGAGHRRERLLLVAADATGGQNNQRERGKLAEAEGCRQGFDAPIGDGSPAQDQASADTDRPGLERHAGHGGGNCGSDEGRPASPSRFQLDLTQADWWAAQSPVCPLVDGLPGGLVESALRCVGNAVVPQVAEIVLRAIGRQIA